MNMEGFRVDPRVTTPLLNGHFGMKDGHFGMKVDILAENRTWHAYCKYQGENATTHTTQNT